MNKEKLKEFLRKKRIIIFALIIVILVSSVVLLLKKENDNLIDTISYQGKTYVYLEYNADIFTYYYNSDDYYEVDVIYPISHDKWDMIYLEDDIFVLDKEVSEAKKYYADDSNYDWFFIVEDNEVETEFSISVSDEELKYLYNMENMKREETMLFTDIKKFGTLKKTSKDGFISSIITLAYYKDSWYWRTEIIDDSKENDPEYVIKLPESLNNKISKLLNEYTN